MNSLLTFYPTIVSLCEKLSFQELKSLSLVSKGWWEVTNSFLINRTFIRISESCEIEFHRKYNHVKVSDISLEYVPGELSDSIETLELSLTDVKDFKQLQKFKKLKSLILENCNISKDCPNQIDLVLGLHKLRVFIDQEDLDIIQELIRANGSIRSLNLHLTTFDEDLFEGEFNDFLRNIHLPRLDEFIVKARNINLNDGLREFFQNHQHLRVCLLNNWDIKDEVIKVLRKSCNNLVKLSLERSLELTKITLNEIMSMERLKHLDLTNTNFAASDLENFSPSRLESFKLSFSSDAAIGGLTALQTQSILYSMKNMRVLNLSQLQSCYGDPVLDCRILSFICQEMPFVIDLNLSGLFAICDDVDVFLRTDLKFKRLEKLDLSFTKLKDKLLCLIFAPKLKSLNINHSDIESKGVKHIVDNSPLIERLSLYNSTKLIEADILYIAENLTLLRTLDLENYELSENGFQTLLSSTRIEECRVSLNGDCEEFAKKEGFEAEYETKSIRGNFRKGPRKVKITNGARSFLIS